MVLAMICKLPAINNEILLQINLFATAQSGCGVVLSYLQVW
jgi:hypothetical protein